MLADDLAAIEEALPELFDRLESPPVPDDLVVVTEDDIILSEDGPTQISGIWDAIDGLDLDENDEWDEAVISDERFETLTSADLDGLCDAIENDETPYGFVNFPEILRIYTRVGGGFGMHGSDNAAGSNLSNPAAINLDVLAFYRPWHYYSEPNYGIYLIFEAARELSRLIRLYSKNFLSYADSVTVAKAFLFHHEQYHNKVEAFATRLEVSHRVPCYKLGFEAIWRADLASGSPEEEGLATAYAVEKIRTSLFRSDKKWGKQKRRVATSVSIALIRHFFSPRCSLALSLIGQPALFEKTEENFQERNAIRSLSLKLTNAAVWNAFGYSMAPSIVRNKSFSYVISRSVLNARKPVHVKHLRAVVRRSDLVSALTYVTGGRILHRGKEPIFYAANGTQASVPAHRYIAEGTANNVVRATLI
jgi:hypothetical protein